MTSIASPVRSAVSALAVLAALAAGAAAAIPARADEKGENLSPTPRVIRGPATSSEAPATPAKVAWNELGPALAEGKKAGKPILVDVYTDWCGWCKRMDKTTYADPAVREYVTSAFVPAKVNAEDDTRRASYRGETKTYRQFADGFRIHGYPTTLFLASDGQLITQLPGYVKPDTFLDVLRYVAEGHYRTRSWEAFTRDGESARP